MKAQKTGSHDCNSGKKNGRLKPVLQMNPLYIVFYVNGIPWNCTAGRTVEVMTNPGLLSSSFVYLLLIRDSWIGTIHPVIFLSLQKSNCFAHSAACIGNEKYHHWTNPRAKTWCVPYSAIKGKERFSPVIPNRLCLIQIH